MIRYILDRPDLNHPWLFERCREVQAAPDGFLDLWSREHYKSTIVTYGLTIQDLLRDPELTVGIFSHTKPAARAFLRQIKRTFETSEMLKRLFPEILWAEPERQAPKWGEEDGLVLRRRGNPKEASIEAWGLVDGQPTGRHFRLMVYDDVVTRDSVATPEMIEKTTEAWALSRNLAAEDARMRMVGTRYHVADTYAAILARGVPARLHPATADGQPDGTPVLIPAERLAEKRRQMGPYVFGCQMLQNPVADRTQGFARDWLRYWSPEAGAIESLHRYLLVDPASGKKRASDYTAAWLIGLSSDRSVYVIDVMRDRLSLTERADLVFDWHRRWRPLKVGYERYGMMGDIEHLRDRMRRDAYHFDVVELGGAMAKADRIRRLVPMFEAGRVFLPEARAHTDTEGRRRDLIADFIDQEYLAFPVAPHDDMLDALSRLLDPALAISWPVATVAPSRWSRAGPRPRGSWMSA